MRFFSTLVIASSLLTAAAVSASQLTGCSSSSQPKKGCDDSAKSAEVSKQCAPTDAAKGIEISTENGDVDWRKVKSQGYSWGVVRVTDGTKSDKKFAKNWVAMKDAGILRAPSHYFRPSLDPKKQAEAFMKNLDLDWWDLGFKYGKLVPGDLPVVLYLEEDETMT